MTYLKHAVCECKHVPPSAFNDYHSEKTESKVQSTCHLFDRNKTCLPAFLVAVLSIKQNAVIIVSLEQLWTAFHSAENQDERTC